MSRLRQHPFLVSERGKHRASRKPHLRVKRTSGYEKVAQVMSAAQTGGLGKIGFVTDPEAR